MATLWRIRYKIYSNTQNRHKKKHLVFFLLTGHHKYTHTHTHIYIYVCVCVCVHIYIYTHTHIHTYTHTHNWKRKSRLYNNTAKVPTIRIRQRSIICNAQCFLSITTYMAFVQWYCVLIFSSSADYLSLFICLISPLSTGIILSFVRAPFSLLKVGFHWSADRLHFISLLDFPFNTLSMHWEQVPPQSGRNGGSIFLRDYVQVNRAEGCYSGNALATTPRLKITVEE